MGQMGTQPFSNQNECGEEQVVSGNDPERTTIFCSYGGISLGVPLDTIRGSAIGFSMTMTALGASGLSLHVSVLRRRASQKAADRQNSRISHIHICETRKVISGKENAAEYFHGRFRTS